MISARISKKERYSCMGWLESIDTVDLFLG